MEPLSSPSSSSSCSDEADPPCNTLDRPVSFEEISRHAQDGCMFCTSLRTGLNAFLKNKMKPDLNEIILEPEESSSLVVRILLKDPADYITTNLEFYVHEGMPILSYIRRPLTRSIRGSKSVAFGGVCTQSSRSGLLDRESATHNRVAQ